MWKSEITFRRWVRHSFHHRFGESSSGPQASGRNAFLRYPSHTQTTVSETVHSDPCVQGWKSGESEHSWIYSNSKKLTQNHSSTKARPFWQDSPTGHHYLTATWGPRAYRERRLTEMCGALGIEEHTADRGHTYRQTSGAHDAEWHPSAQTCDCIPYGYNILCTSFLLL